MRALGTKLGSMSASCNQLICLELGLSSSSHAIQVFGVSASRPWRAMILRILECAHIKGLLMQSLKLEVLETLNFCRFWVWMNLSKSNTWLDGGLGLGCCLAHDVFRAGVRGLRIKDVQF